MGAFLCLLSRVLGDIHAGSYRLTPHIYPCFFDISGRLCGVMTEPAPYLLRFKITHQHFEIIHIKVDL